MKATLTALIAMLLLAACTNDDTIDPTAQPPAPTFDAAQDWNGNDSPVLAWDDAQRRAAIAEYQEAIDAALAAAGVDTTPVSSSTAVDGFTRADAIGTAIPRPVREIALLDTAEQLFDERPTKSQEAATLDAAWTTCKQLESGTTYKELVFAASKAATDPDLTAQERARLTGILYAPVVCPQFANDALTTIAGIDGLASAAK